MMREMKDHELERVVGGRAGEPDSDADNISRFEGTKFTDKYMAASAKAAPFLLPETSPGHKPGFTQPPKNLPGAPNKQVRKGGPFTFKTPYLNR